MIKSFLTIGFCLFCFVSNCISQEKALDIHIIPEPVSISQNDGIFRIDKNTQVVFHGQEAKDLTETFITDIRVPTGFKLAISDRVHKNLDNVIIIKLNNLNDNSLKKEGYTLKVSPKNVTIIANDPAGLFYGLQTLLQLLPPSIESKTIVPDTRWDIPCVEIVDYPRFAWRGLMLDVSRHFFTVEEVKKYIDEMSKYKYNVFHWHLTDNQGWRIQIKELPELTTPEVNAYVKDFYTQAEIREIVSYAKRRFVNILPEIDVPSHSRSLIKAFPSLATRSLDSYNTKQARNFYMDNNIINVASDSTWLILNKIFTEVAELFPFKYIHVGADEANHSFWLSDSKVNDLMEKERLQTGEDLQRFFGKKLQKIVDLNGKKMIGWDEIALSGIPKETTVMTRKYEQILPEIKSNQPPLIITTNENCYIDRYQGDPLIEPRAHKGFNILSSSYALNMVPRGTIASQIIGGEGCLWTEEVPNYRHVEYMTWPRAFALAEVFWSPKDNRNWERFIKKMEARFKYLDIANVNYSLSQYDAIITGVNDNGNLMVKLKTQIPGIEIYYRFDGTNPDNFSPKYSGQPLSIPKDAKQIRVITYRDGKPIGKQINCPVKLIKERVNEDYIKDIQY